MRTALRYARTLAANVLVALFLLLPVIGIAATNINETLHPFFAEHYDNDAGFLPILLRLIPFMLTLAVLAFLWGLVKFIYQADDPKSHETGKRVMIWGVIGIAVLVLSVGIIQLIMVIFGLDPRNDRYFSVFGPPGYVAVPFAEADKNAHPLIWTLANDLRPFLQLIAQTLFYATWLVFFFGIARFIYALSNGDEEGIRNGKMLLIWGIVALTVAFSLWGIIWIMARSLGFTDSSNPEYILIPQFRTN